MIWILKVKVLKFFYKVFTKSIDDGDFVTVPLLASMDENNIFYCSKANSTEVLMTRFLISCKQTIQDSMKCLKPEV